MKLQIPNPAEFQDSKLSKLLREANFSEGQNSSFFLSELRIQWLHVTASFFCFKQRMKIQSYFIQNICIWNTYIYPLLLLKKSNFFWPLRFRTKKMHMKYIGIEFHSCLKFIFSLCRPWRCAGICCIFKIDEIFLLIPKL